MLLKQKHKNLSQKDVKKAREYIKSYWPKITVSNKKTKDTLIGLPNPYIVPAIEKGNEFEFSEQYYWDTYFTIQGLLSDKKNKKLVIGMLDNLVYMLKKYGVIPNASRTYMVGHSQPPLLTSLAWDIYEAYDMSLTWLGKYLAFAMREYKEVWLAEKKPHSRKVHKGLSRYYDINELHDLAETESGWDMTPRFSRKCLDYLAVDLNTYLYMYELHFARYFHLRKKGVDAAKWEANARRRKYKMKELMYNSRKGLYFDYNYKKTQMSSVSSLAGLIPMWAGMIDRIQAKKMVKAMKRFEQKGGLSVTDVQNLNIKIPGATPTQWAFPNGWAPMHFLVVRGLEKYGFHRDAKRIAMKWLKTNLDWYNKHGVFIEKYNVASPQEPPAKGVYSTPTGFGWTNSVFEYFCQKYIDNDRTNK